jgi:hypothetical protein
MFRKGTKKYLTVEIKQIKSEQTEMYFDIFQFHFLDNTIQKKRYDYGIITLKEE